MGITDENRDMFQLMNPVKSAVSRIRQIFRQDMPKILSEKFSRKLTDVEWGQLHLGLARTDLAALGETIRIRNIREMLSDSSKLDLAISKEEETLKGLSKKNLEKVYVEKAKDLAQFMTSYKLDKENHFFARNAMAIAMLAGDNGAMVKDPSPELVASIDRLVSLYALDMLDPAVKTSLKTLADSETEGVEFILGYLRDLRSKEQAKATTKIAQLNGYKGYVPAETKEGVSLIVAADADHNYLVQQGYTRMGDYRGSGLEAGRKINLSDLGLYRTRHRIRLQDRSTATKGLWHLLSNATSKE